jgi:ribosomal protein S18 acetylase RimI-like enzyme
VSARRSTLNSMDEQERATRKLVRRGIGLTVDVRPLLSHELPMVEAFLPSPDREVHARRIGSQHTGGSTYFIAWLGDRPVGHTVVRWGGSQNPLLATPGSPPPVHPYIEGLAVHYAYRSRGIGGQIIEAAESESRRRGHREIGLAVNVENVRARALYARLGYRDLGVSEFPNIWSYRDDAGQRHVEVESCIYLVKTLANDDSSGSIASTDDAVDR